MTIELYQRTKIVCSVCFDSVSQFFYLLIPMHSYLCIPGQIPFKIFQALGDGVIKITEEEALGYVYNQDS